jgi:hypothetical protein
MPVNLAYRRVGRYSPSAVNQFIALSYCGLGRSK